MNTMIGIIVKTSRQRRPFSVIHFQYYNVHGGCAYADELFSEYAISYNLDTHKWNIFNHTRETKTRISPFETNQMTT